MNPIHQCYEILGLKPGASLEQVKQAYRDLAMVWHPDRFPNNPRLQEKAQEELKQINEAYEVLKSSTSNSSASACSSSYSNSTEEQPDSQKTQQSHSNYTEICFEQGMDKARRGMYQESIDDFNLAIRSNPNCVAAFKFRGIAYLKLKDKQRAFYDFKQAAGIYLKLNDVEGYHNIIQMIISLKTSENSHTAKVSYRKLQEFLLVGAWKEADKETLSVMLKIVVEKSNHF